MLFYSSVQLCRFTYYICLIFFDLWYIQLWTFNNTIQDPTENTSSYKPIDSIINVTLLYSDQLQFQTLVKNKCMQTTYVFICTNRYETVRWYLQSLRALYRQMSLCNIICVRITCSDMRRCVMIYHKSHLPDGRWFLSW